MITEALDETSTEFLVEHLFVSNDDLLTGVTRTLVQVRASALPYWLLLGAAGCCCCWWWW